MGVLLVTGAMRSGTTITGQMLAESRDTILVGELRPVVLEPDRHAACDCGHPRGSCPFWGIVYADLPADFDDLAAARAFKLSALPRLLAHLLLRVPLPRDAEQAVAFLRAVAGAAGARTVIDTTKGPPSILLWRIARQKVHIVHCWRSARQVAIAQAKPSAESGLVQEPMIRSYAIWIAYNGLSVLLRPWARGYTLVPYARLLEAPRAYAERIWRRVGATVPDPGGGASFAFAESHVLAGNPRRAKGGSVTIAPAAPRLG